MPGETVNPEKSKARKVSVTTTDIGILPEGRLKNKDRARPTARNRPMSQASASTKIAIQQNHDTGKEAQIVKLISEIKEHSRKNTLFSLQKGAEIIALKEDTEHGDLLNRLELEAGLRPRKAQRWMRAATAFHGQFSAASHLSQQSVYDLSTDQPWVPAVREEVLQLLEAGNEVTQAQVTDMCDKARHEYQETEDTSGSSPAPETQKRIDAVVQALTPILMSQKDEFLKLLKSRHWADIKKRLVKELSST